MNTKGIVAALALASFLTVSGPVSSPAGADAASRKAHPAYLEGASGGGDRILFSTAGRLDGLDRDDFDDVYEFRNGRTRLVTITPPGGHEKGRIWTEYSSPEEARIILSTAASYSPEDLDQDADIYEVRGDQVDLLTPDRIFAEDCSSVRCPFWIAGTADDGDIIYLSSNLRLTADDSDSGTDLFELRDGTVRLLSGGPLAGGADSSDVTSSEPSHTADGSTVYFSTKEPLAIEDTDTEMDAYSISSGVPKLVTPWATSGPVEGVYAFPSKKVPFRYFVSTTAEYPGFPAANKGFRKLYVVEGGTPRLIGAGEEPPFYSGESPDGASIYFSTTDSFSPEDTDRSGDVYTWTDGEIELFSTGPRGSGDAANGFGSAAVEKVVSDGGVYFTTSDQLVGADNDGYKDLYLKKGDQVSLISTSAVGRNDAGSLDFISVEDDGQRVLMSTSSRWTDEDRDRRGIDLYVREGGKLRLVSKGALSDAGSGWSYDIYGRHLSGDRYAFATLERLQPDDSDQRFDVYVTDLAKKNSTRIVSEGDLRIGSGPVGTTSGTRATFRFALAGAKPKFLCSLDGRKLRPCRSPVTFRGLEEGEHQFRVVSTGPKGLGRSVSARRDFRVKITAGQKPNLNESLVAVSGDGKRVIVETGSPLAKADRDVRPDLYQLVQGDPAKLLTPRTAGGVRPSDVSSDANRVIFRSDDRIDPADLDFQSDIYQWRGRAARLLPAGLDLIDRPVFDGASDDGRTIVFSSRQRLSAADTDEATDVYTSGPAGIVLMSPGTEPGIDAGSARISADGTSVVFRTRERLDPADVDGEPGLYWSDGTRVRMITAGSDEVERLDPVVRAMPGDGSSVVFETVMPLLPSDIDTQRDVYRWKDGTLTLLSEVEEAGDEQAAYLPPVKYGTERVFPENPPFSGYTYPVSGNGSAVVIQTLEGLIPADRDNDMDVYVNRNGDLELMDPGRAQSSRIVFRGADPGLRTVFVETAEALVRSDRDKGADLYGVSGGKARRITRGLSGPRLAVNRITWVSRDSRSVAFTSRRSILKSDRDGGVSDLYLWKDGRTTLLSDWAGERASAAISNVKSSANGKFHYFETKAALVRADRDRTTDVYRVTRGGPVKLSRPRP